MANRIIASLALALLTLGIGSAAQAQPADNRTYFTFSSPVTLPGVTLPAGKYIFRIADENSGRRVVAIQSGDGKKQLAMLLTIPNQAPKAPSDPEIRFMETSSNVPPPVNFCTRSLSVSATYTYVPAGESGHSGGPEPGISS